jgi:dimethylhistidine N-methyltransferase
VDAAANPAPARRRPTFIESEGGGARDARDELLAGLRAQPARITPKYFYDALGSRLFEAICELPEYYLTRTEAQIIERHGAEIALAVGFGCTLIDLGAGNCEKAERLFGLLRPAQYVAIDISAAFLRQRLECLQDKHPQLDVVGIGMDFANELRLPAAVRRERRLFFYPGSSIGNFTPQEAAAFLRRLRSEAGEDGALLIGVDLLKDQAALDAAYDDALGVTAAFNLNVLNHVNRVLGTDFDVRDWRHVAFFDARESRIEMHLEARRALQVSLPGGARPFAAGERIHTENSYKYSAAGFRALLAQAGFGEPTAWLDPDARFAVLLARPR